MTMAKKISLFLSALMAIAIPATAAASTGLTSPAGVLVPVGTLITKTSTGTVVVNTSKLGELKCGTVKLKGKVTKNNASEGVAATGEGTGTASSCKTAFGAEFSVDELDLLSTLNSPPSTPGRGTASFSFNATLPGQVCHLVGTNVVGTYTANTNVFSLSSVPLTVSGTNCGTSATLTGSFALTKTSGGAAVYIM